VRERVLLSSLGLQGFGKRDGAIDDLTFKFNVAIKYAQKTKLRQLKGL
jgi:hypothetical protein